MFKLYVCAMSFVGLLSFQVSALDKYDFHCYDEESCQISCNKLVKTLNLNDISFNTEYEDYQLGMCFINGYGVKKSINMGIALIKRAATSRKCPEATALTKVNPYIGKSNLDLFIE